MKYWVFQNNQVVGPFDREAMGQVAGFSSETLVCPEGRKGTQMGDWTRAGVVPEMAEALLAATRTPAMARAGVERGAGSMLPPEPTLRDLAVLGSLQERVSSLETLTNRLNDDLHARDTEISRLKVELDQKSRSAAELQTKLAELEVKAHGFAGVKDEVERAREDARVSSIKIEEHQRALEDLRARVAGGQAAEPAAIPNMSQPAFPTYPPAMGAAAGPVGMTPGLGGLPAMAGPMGGARPGSMGRMGEFSPPIADPFAPADIGASGSRPAENPADPFAMPASSLPPGEAGPEPLVSLGAPSQGLGGMGGGSSQVLGDPSQGLGGPSQGLGGPSQGLGGALYGAPTSSPPPLVSVGDMPQSPKPRDKRIFFIIGLMALCVVVGVVLLGGKKKKKKSAFPKPSLVTPIPSPGTVTEGPPASEPALDLTQAAVDFVKGYQIPGRQETVAQLLESRYPTTGRLSPWMVEKLENDKYQVNFWASQSEGAAGPKPVFKFQARVRSRLLQGLNPEAMSLLNNGTLPTPETPKPARRSRASRTAVPRGGAALPRSGASVSPAGGDIQVGGDEPKAAAPPRRVRRSRKAPGVDAAAAVLEGLKAGTKAAQPPKPKSKGKAKPVEDSAPEQTQLPPEEPSAAEGSPAGEKTGAPKSEEDDMLDQLLLPGLDKKTAVKKH